MMVNAKKIICSFVLLHFVHAHCSMVNPVLHDNLKRFSMQKKPTVLERRTFVSPEIKKMQSDRQELIKSIREYGEKNFNTLAFSSVYFFNNISGIYPGTLSPYYTVIHPWSDIKKVFWLSSLRHHRVGEYSSIGLVIITRRDVLLSQKRDLIKELYNKGHKPTSADIRMAFLEWLERIPYDQAMHIYRALLCDESIIATLPIEVVNHIVMRMLQATSFLL
jgi:hypothetical protein